MLRQFITYCLVCCITIFCFHCQAEIVSESALTPAMILENAIKEGKTSEVLTLIEAGIDVNQPLEQGVMPLHAAVIHNQESIAAALIQAGANVNAMDLTTQATPLHLASLYGREGIATLLITKGANVNANMKFGITPILVATQFGQIQLIQLLLDKKASINHADQEGFSALHFAAQNGDAIATRLLIDKGANVKLQDHSKATPFMVAIKAHHTEVAQILKESGGD